MDKETITNPDLIAVMSRLLAIPDHSYWWEQHRKTALESPERFASLKISGECIGNSSDAIGADVGALYALGLYPVIVHGYGKALTRLLQEKGIESRFDDDEDRITDDAVVDHASNWSTMDFVVNLSRDFGQKLAVAIERYGARTKLMPYDEVFRVAQKGSASTGNPTGSRNGRIVHVNLEGIIQAVNEHCIPIISPVGADESGVLYNVNADTAASELVRSLRPRKYIMLTDKNGILDSSGQTLNEVMLRRDYDALAGGNAVTGGMKKKLDEVRAVLQYLGERHSAQITTPENLIYELFTNKGAGTFVQLGYLLAQARLSDFTLNELNRLSLASFRQQLVPDYIQRAGDAVVITEQDMKGAGVFLLHLGNGVGPYLDLLMVDEGSQHNGLGMKLMLEGMQMLGLDDLSWRSRNDRPINRRYMGEASGHQKITSVDGIPYNAYWKGRDMYEALPAVRFMEQKPSNFAPQEQK